MSWLFSAAMMKDYASSRSSPELVEEYSADTCSDGEPSAQLNVMPTPHKFWRNDKTMEFSRLSQFGLTLRLLTESHGEAVLMSYLAAFPVRTSAQPVKAQELAVPEADCGQSSQGSFARYDRATHSLRTAQCSLLEDLTEFYVTLPRWGSMRNGALYLRKIPALHTAEKESGSWPTPNCIGFRSDGELKLLAKMACSHAEYLAMSDRACNSKRQRHYPTATAYKGWSPNHNRANTDDRLDYTIEREAAAEGLTGRLNPEWVEWLMGWPAGMTELKPLETAKFHEWQQQHGDYSQNEIAA